MLEKVKPQIDETWYMALKPEFESNNFQNIMAFLQTERAMGKAIYPQESEIFHAFDLCPLPKVKVVIIGQDPYHGPNQAHGLCFSVKKDVKAPPSLANIFKEIKTDLGFEFPNHGDLTNWAKDGVLLLNSVLTVEAHKPASHKKLGWQKLTDAAIKAVSEQNENVVFMLWGNFSQQKKHLINAEKHLVLESVHPSPLSAYNGFFGCKHFSICNNYLLTKNIEIIDWRL